MMGDTDGRGMGCGIPAGGGGGPAGRSGRAAPSACPQCWQTEVPGGFSAPPRGQGTARPRWSGRGSTSARLPARRESISSPIQALNAASAIGDDRIQMQSRGYVVPDTFTHGTSEQRSRWFRLGYETGDLSRGDTFSASIL